MCPSEAGGERPRRLEYVRGTLLDRLAEDAGAIDEVVARIQASGDADEIGVLVQLLEEHAAVADEATRARLEGIFLGSVRGETQADRRNAALHYLLTAAESGALSEGTIDALRSLAKHDASGLVRAGAMWLVGAREDQAARDARLLAAMASDPDATVRETAAEGLGVLGSGLLATSDVARVVEVLATESVPAVRVRLLDSLAQRGVVDPSETVHRLGALGRAEADVDVRRGYVSAIAQIGGVEARALLESFVTDPAVGEDAKAFLDHLSAPAIEDDHHHHERVDHGGGRSFRFDPMRRHRDDGHDDHPRRGGRPGRGRDAPGLVRPVHGALADRARWHGDRTLCG